MSKDELLFLKQQELILLQKRRELQKANGLVFYKPHKKQELFHRAGHAKHRLFEAGNRTGKSEAGIVEDISFLVGERPFFPKGDPARTAGIPNHPVKGIVITTDWDMVNDNFTTQQGKDGRQGKVWQYLPKGWLKRVSRNAQGVIDRLEGHNGSVLIFETVKSFLHNPQSVESRDCDFCHFDEPLPISMYNGLARGLIDRNGKDWFTLTPLREPWIDEMFFPDDKKDIFEVWTENRQLNLWAIRASIYDNPYLQPEAVEDFLKRLPPDEREARAYGIPLHKSGLVYKDFNKAIHVLQSIPHGWNAFNDPPKDYTVYVAIDPHPHTPHAILYLAVSPTGKMFLFDEIWHKSTISELCSLHNQKIQNRFVASVVVDPWVYSDDPITGACVAQEFLNHGVFLEKACKERSAGTLIVQEILRERDCEGNPVLYVSPTCERTIWEFGHYNWKVNNLNIALNKPEDKNDHMMENLYRLLFNRPQYISFEKDTIHIEDEDFIGPQFSFERISWDD